MPSGGKGQTVHLVQGFVKKSLPPRLHWGGKPHLREQKWLFCLRLQWKYGCPLDILGGYALVLWRMHRLLVLENCRGEPIGIPHRRDKSSFEIFITLSCTSQSDRSWIPSSPLPPIESYQNICVIPGRRHGLLSGMISLTHVSVSNTNVCLVCRRNYPIGFFCAK